MPTYKFNGHIAEDHTIELPADIPTGWAEVVVTTESGRGSREALEAVLRDLAQRKPHNRSKDDIDAELRAERDNWE